MDIKKLPTEQRNQDTIQIDELCTLDMLKLINNEDQKVALCIGENLPAIAAAIDAIAEKYSLGGRIIYCGAGTSGRMGFMDSAECPPTFGISPDRVVALMAGGIGAIQQSVEGAEDDTAFAAEQLKQMNFNANDVLIGIAASGRTPYAIGGLEYAKSIGAVTVSITCTTDMSSPMNSLADYPIGIYCGPEVISGSTRMKSGTVQKLVLNMISTTVMIRTGKVYSNLMVNVQCKNAKLRIRAKNIVAEITEADESRIQNILEQTEYNVSLTIFMILTDTEKEEAEKLLEKSGGHIKNALKQYHSNKK